MGGWSVFWKWACARTPMDAANPILSAMWRVGTLRRIGDGKGLVLNSCEPRRTGHVGRDASRWRRIRRLAMRCRNVRTRPWDLRLSSAVWFTARRYRVAGRGDKAGGDGKDRSAGGKGQPERDFLGCAWGNR